MTNKIIAILIILILSISINSYIPNYNLDKFNILKLDSGKKQLIIFLTHNFNKEFINTLSKIDNDTNINNFKVIVLFDMNNIYDNNIDNKFKNIEIIKINKIESSYDRLGHTMYLNYFKQNYNLIDKYDYIWIIENDVYYPDSLIEFININNNYHSDLLVSEYGTRSLNWGYTSDLKGFTKTFNIGVLAVIMRISQKLLIKLIDNIDINYYGYLESILPHICLENNLTIQTFLPETCGILTTDNSSPLIKLIESNIVDNKNNYIEKKIYHPIKL
jgi:hypothetical protein